MSPIIGPDPSYFLSIFISIIVLLIFLLMLVGSIIYMLFYFHKKWLKAVLNAPMLSESWLSEYARVALSSNSSIFGRLFSQPIKDGHNWTFLKGIDQRFLWVCLKNAKMGFWTLDMEGTPMWMAVQLDLHTLLEYLHTNKEQEF